jgi:hypothetical protein
LAYFPSTRQKTKPAIKRSAKYLFLLPVSAIDEILLGKVLLAGQDICLEQIKVGRALQEI